MLSAAQMLDELMGRDRNLAPTEKRREVRWDDPEVCKYFLCGFCPHELFVNTRADLGVCDKLHDEKLRDGYEKSGRYERMGYEEEFLRFLQSLLSDVERRIRKGQARLALNNTQGGMAGGPQIAREEKISMMTEKINDLVQNAGELGCEGKVDEAQAMMKLCEQLTEERAQIESVQAAIMGGPDDGKAMQVCEVCGALLVVGDAQQRVDEHLLGKQHMGYAKVREYVTNHRDKTKKRRGEDSEREALLIKEREEREKEREDRRKKREQEEKEREERRRKKSRSRSKSRSRRRSRSRSRSRRHKRSRSRERDRQRSRSRGRRHRSRSRGRRHRRSRSRGSRRSSRDRSSRGRDSDRKSRDKDHRKDSDSTRDHNSEERKSKKESNHNTYDDEPSTKSDDSETAKQ